MTEGRQRKKPRNKNEVQRFWNFVPDEENNTAEMLLYGEISEYSWYGDEITPGVFNQELKDLGPVDEITVRINSGGGDVFAAVAIWCCTIKVDIENSKGQYIEKDKQEATKDGSESTKIQHGI